MLADNEATLREFCARMIGWASDRALAVDHAVRSLELAANHRAALVLLGDGDLVPIVRSGRSTLDEPTDLPEGTIERMPAEDGFDTLSGEERASLHCELDASMDEEAAGRLVDAKQFVAELRASREARPSVRERDGPDSLAPTRRILRSARAARQDLRRQRKAM